FGGMYRIVDFVLSNFVNSGMRSIYVLTQFKSQSLTEHLHRAWAGTNLRPGNFIIPVPAQMQTPGAVWYAGTGDAIYQNLNLVRETQPDYVCIFGGDHIYYMNIARMLRRHVKSGAEVSIASIPVARSEGPRLGVIEADASGWIQAFHEKVADPPTMPDDPARCYASMGNYVFTREVLEQVLVEDFDYPDSKRDFGGDILPRMVAAGRKVLAYNFETNTVPGRPRGAPNTYWRDVGTLDAYFEANLDLKEVVPQLDLYNPEWPINTLGSSAPACKFVHDARGRKGEAIQSVISAGSIVSGSLVRESVLGRNVHVHSHSSIEESVIMDSVTIGRRCRIRRAIIDKDVTLESGTEVGYDAESDRDRGWTVTPSGITVIPKSPVVRPVAVLNL
ncbi:MAG: glucose-1-phosphate adenylyltransferase, partial [Planctomycetota bacterium]